MADYLVSAQAYVKLLLHAAKYPTNACCGVLIGEETPSQGFHITDAVPLFHHTSPLSPMVEVACTMIDTWCQTQKKKIVGYYHANEFGSEATPALNVFGEKMADKIEANCSRACVILIDNQQLHSESKLGLHFLLKDVKRGWIRVDNRLRVEEEKDMAASVVFSKALTQHAQQELVDFDEHVENVSKDWRNPNLMRMIRLNL